MKTRISAIVGLLCVVGAPLFASAGSELPTISRGTIEPYISVMAGIAVQPTTADATFTDGTSPGIVKDIEYQTKHSVGGNAGIWFPTRNKLAGFDLGVEISGFIWYADVACCVNNFNYDSPTDSFGPNRGGGNTTEVQGIYVGPNFLVRYPMAVSQAYPNGRWFPYVGIGIGAHQMAMRPGGARGTGFLRAITEERDTSIGWMAMGGIKGHLFKYVSVFAEAKYVQAHHDALNTDRWDRSGPAFDANTALFSGQLIMNRYESTIDTIFAHAGMSIHFDIKP